MGLFLRLYTSRQCHERYGVDSRYINDLKIWRWSMQKVTRFKKGCFWCWLDGFTMIYCIICVALKICKCSSFSRGSAELSQLYHECWVELGEWESSHKRWQFVLRLGIAPTAGISQLAMFMTPLLVISQWLSHLEFPLIFHEYPIMLIFPWYSHHPNQDSIESRYMMLKFQAISQRAAILEALLRCRSLWAAESDDHDLVKAATTGIPPWLWKPQDLKKYWIVFFEMGVSKVMGVCTPIYSWMVYFMEKLNYKWMITRGTPFGETTRYPMDAKHRLKFDHLQLAKWKKYLAAALRWKKHGMENHHF